MNTADILAHIDDLPRDKLTYFVRAGYVTAKKVRRGSLDYNEFSDYDLKLIEIAWGYIKDFDMRTKAAFNRAKKELDNPQMSLF